VLLGLRSTARVVGIILAAIAVCVAVLEGLFLLAVGGCTPSDRKMTRYFAENRSGFERLLNGYSANELAELGVEWVDTEFSTGDPYAVGFVTFDGSVWAGSHHWKGYLHSHVAPPAEERRDDGTLAYVFDRIEGDWYVYEYIDP
jgi:hypothetical protein